LSLRRAVLPVFDFKNAVKLKTPPFDRVYMTSYSRAIETMALSHVVFEIVNVENVVTLKSGSEVTQGH